MKHFEVPLGYRSSLISAIKEKRKEEDKLKKDTQPTLLDLGNLKIYLARHFGFVMVLKMRLKLLTEPLNPIKAKEYFY